MDNTLGNLIPTQEQIEHEGGTKAVETIPYLEADGTVSCVICLNSISERCFAKPCRHSYHYMCILKWLGVRQSCPLCNAHVSELLSHTEDGRVHRVDMPPGEGHVKCGC